MIIFYQFTKLLISLKINKINNSTKNKNIIIENLKSLDMMIEYKIVGNYKFMELIGTNN